MAKTQNSKSKPHLFLSCFGFSGKLRRFKPVKPTAGHKKRPFSWMTFHSKPQPPVRYSIPAEQNRSKLVYSDRLSSTPTATYKSWNEEAKDNFGEKLIFQSCEYSDSPKKPEGESQSRFSILTRKFESFRLGRFAQPASPTVKKNPKSTTISHSLSFPPPKSAGMSCRPLNVSSSMRIGSRLGVASKKKNQPVTGMSIVIITLAIMVLWGKLCAILCTATWIFIVTSLRSGVEKDDAIDFIEQGLKKKLLVLKGFLYKNQRENLLRK